jgi:hypothetical protein
VESRGANSETALPIRMTRVTDHSCDISADSAENILLQATCPPCGPRARRYVVCTMTKVRMAKALTVHDVLVLVCKGRRATRIEIALVKRPIRRQGVCQRQIELLSRLHTSHMKWSSTNRWHGRLIHDRCPSCFDADALHTKPPQRSREQASNKPSCSEKGVQERPRRKDVGGAVPRHAATDGPQPTRIQAHFSTGEKF